MNEHQLDAKERFWTLSASQDDANYALLRLQAAISRKEPGLAVLATYASNAISRLANEMDKGYLWATNYLIDKLEVQADDIATDPARSVELRVQRKQLVIATEGWATKQAEAVNAARGPLLTVHEHARRIKQVGMLMPAMDYIRGAGKVLALLEGQATGIPAVVILTLGSRS